MADKMKTDDSGKCLLCESVPPVLEVVQCYFCKGCFHGVCPQASKEEKTATKSMFINFNAESTKNNFKFFCDECLTYFELDQAKSNNDRMQLIEKNVSKIAGELGELKTLLKNNNSNETDSQIKSNLVEIKSMLNVDPVSKIDHSVSNVWLDPERLKGIKAPQAKPMLVLNKRGDENNSSIEKVILDNKIPVTKSYKNNEGDLVLVCDSENSRDKLQNMIKSSDETLKMSPMTSKQLIPITIVGFTKEFSKEELVEQLLSQNYFLKQFSESNVLEDHLKIHDIKATKARDYIFQAFASVSAFLRTGLKNYRDKLIVGIQSCKVYDRHQVKRCNNCQGIGHFYKDCPTPNKPTCAKCSESHATSTCTSSVKKCINCFNSSNPDSNHAAFDPNCPTIISSVEQLKKRHLNSQ